MSSPAPLLRPPVPGERSQSGTRTPRLRLGIPPSPNIKPVADQGQAIPQDITQSRPLSRPDPPRLNLATPSGSNGAIGESSSHANLRQIPPLNIPAAINGNSDASNHSRSGSFTNLDGKASGPDSASSSQYSVLSILRNTQQISGTPDPSSAISSVYSEAGGVSMEREGSMNGLLPDLEKLSLDKGRPLDVEDLDDEGWLAASEQKKIVELGSLGEGAGGAVTRCFLHGGSTVFALKVCKL